MTGRLTREERKEYPEGNNSNFTFQQQDIAGSGLQNSLYQNITQKVMGGIPDKGESQGRVVDSEIVDSNVLSSLIQESDLQNPTTMSVLIKHLIQAKHDPCKISEVIGELTRMKHVNEDMGLKMISLEEENKFLKQKKGGMVQSNFSELSIGESIKVENIPDKFNDTDKKFEEIRQESTSSLSRKSVSSEVRSPQNSVQSGRPASETDSSTQFRALETIPENTDEHLSMNRTREISRGSDFPSKQKSDIHLSMPVSRGKDCRVSAQPEFMFNSLQKDSVTSRVPSFPGVGKSDIKVSITRINEPSCSRPAKRGRTTTPFEKPPRIWTSTSNPRTARRPRVKKEGSQGESRPK